MVEDGAPTMDQPTGGEGERGYSWIHAWEWETGGWGGMDERGEEERHEGRKKKSNIVLLQPT